MTAPVHCSFCGKSQHDVRQVIVGPAVYICDECVSLCCEIVQQNGHGAVPFGVGRMERANVRLRAFEILGQSALSGQMTLQEAMDKATALAGWALDSTASGDGQSGLSSELAHALALARPLLEYAPERFYDRIAQIDATLGKAEAAGLGRIEGVA